MENKNYFKKIFNKRFGVFVFIIVSIFLVYFSTLSHKTVMLDDDKLVLEHYQFNKKLSNIPLAFKQNIFMDPGDLSFYRPILRLSFMFDAQFGPKNIFFMSHLTNMVLHTVAMCLLFVLLCRLEIEKLTALFFTLFFSVHPIGTQTVSLIVGRNDALLAIFAFSSFIFLVDFLNYRKIGKYFLHLFFFIIALFTKETALVLPGIFIVYILLFTTKNDLLKFYKKYLMMLGVYISVLVFYFLTRHLVLNGFVGKEVAGFDILKQVINPIISNIPSVIPAVGKIFLPFDLALIPVMADMQMIYGYMVFVFFLIYFFFAKKKNNRLIIFGVSWFILFWILTLITQTGLIPNFSENRLYVPILGFIFIILGMGILTDIKSLLRDKIKNARIKEVIILVSLICIITIFALVTIYRNRFYKNELTFWTQAVKESPHSSFSQNNFGVINHEKNPEIAMEAYKKAIKINDTERFAHFNLAILYEKDGNLKGAQYHYEKEIEANPQWKTTYYNLEALFVRQKKFKEGIKYWTKMYDLHGDRLGALYNLIDIHYQSGEKNKAALYAKEALNRGLPLPQEFLDLISK
jgi:tetratricopeptide (TPR) repeat protein